MGSEAMKWTLTIVGALLELGGIGLVALDVLTARRDARWVLDAGPEPKGPTRTVGKSFRVAYDIEGRQPELDERVELLERKVERLFDDLSSRDDELRQTLRDEIARTGTEVMKLADERDRALRAFVSAQLAGGVRRGGAGAILFALGVILSAAANLIG